jgi:hypothetical protein
MAPHFADLNVRLGKHLAEKIAVDWESAVVEVDDRVSREQYPGKPLFRLFLASPLR